MEHPSPGGPRFSRKAEAHDLLVRGAIGHSALEPGERDPLIRHDRVDASRSKESRRDDAVVREPELDNPVNRFTDLAAVVSIVDDFRGKDPLGFASVTDTDSFHAIVLDQDWGA